MKKYNFRKSFALFFILTAITLSSCSKKGSDSFEPEQYTSNEYIMSVFYYWYFWNDQIPSDISYNGISKELLLASIKKDVTYDPWSFVTTLTEYTNLTKNDIYHGLGASFVLDLDDSIKVGHVMTNSPLGEKGVKRGWRLLSVNGEKVLDMNTLHEKLAVAGTFNFNFLDLNHVAHNIEVSSGTVEYNAMLDYNIFTRGSKKIGYIALASFNENSKDDMNFAFNAFNAENITDIVVDLRYNAGGDIESANYLIAYLGGEKTRGKKIASIVYNSLQTANNIDYMAEDIGLTTNFKTIHFITSNVTSAAAEMVINSLYPYMGVYLIGAHTEGKPYGNQYFGFEDLDLLVSPVTYHVVNANGDGQYSYGINVNKEVADDLDHDFGDQSEKCLKTALDFIETGAVSPSDKSTNVKSPIYGQYDGINRMVRMY